MMMSPENVAVWNRLGLIETNGTVTMPVERFERALELARLQSSTPGALKGDAK